MADDTPADYDSPWKEALALYFREFLQLLQPGPHHQIDWSVAPMFLDKASPTPEASVTTV